MNTITVDPSTIENHGGTVAGQTIHNTDPLPVNPEGEAKATGFLAAVARIAELATFTGDKDAWLMDKRNTLTSLIHDTLNATAKITKTFVADSVETLAVILYHMRESGKDATNKLVADLLAPFTNENQQTTESKRVVFFARNGGRYDVTEHKAPRMSKNMAQMYRDMARWRAGLFDKKAEVIPGETALDVTLDHEQGNEALPLLATGIWKTQGQVYINDRDGNGWYHDPVSALRDGRGFAVTYTAFRNVIRPSVDNLGPLSADSERAAYEFALGDRKAERPGVQVVVRATTRALTSGQMGEKTVRRRVEVAKDKRTLRGMINGLATGAMSKGTVNKEGLIALFEEAVEHALANAVPEDVTDEE